jgi:hypothetical protein
MKLDSEFSRSIDFTLSYLITWNLSYFPEVTNQN